MDVHKNYLQLAIHDDSGKVLSNSTVDNNLTKVNEFLVSHARFGSRTHPWYLEEFEYENARTNIDICLDSSHLWQVPLEAARALVHTRIEWV